MSATSDTSATATSTGIPSALPKIIEPPKGYPPQQPQNTTLIQIGFLYALNYAFVVHTPESISQIFTYLPEGLAFALGIPSTQITMQALQPYDTSATLDYITTLATAYIPSDLVDPLSLQVLNPNSALYDPSDPTVKTLMGMINSAIPILAGQGMAGGPTPTNGATAQSSDAPNGDGSPLGGSTGESAAVRPKSAAIGVGVVCGAAVYGAAMFFVARRYRNRKKRHARSSSMIDTRHMSRAERSGAGAALMTGARGANGDGARSTTPGGTGNGRYSRSSGQSGGASARTQMGQISAPVMAENSLGWN